jgi:hypothetical protein
MNQETEIADEIRGSVLVQREMESRGFSIASIPPLRGGDFQGMGKSIEADAGGEDGG